MKIRDKYYLSLQLLSGAAVQSDAEEEPLGGDLRHCLNPNGPHAVQLYAEPSSFPVVAMQRQDTLSTGVQSGCASQNRNLDKLEPNRTVVRSFCFVYIVIAHTDIVLSKKIQHYSNLLTPHQDYSLRKSNVRIRLCC